MTRCWKSRSEATLAEAFPKGMFDVRPLLPAGSNRTPAEAVAAFVGDNRSTLLAGFYDAVLTRRLADDVNPYQMQFLGSVAAMAALGMVVLVGSLLSIPGATMSALTWQETGWVIGMGIAATLGHAFIVLAAGKAPANLLAPFQYVEIIGATILGYLVFGDIPANSTVLGVGIIIASGLYLFHRERIATRKQVAGR